MFSCPRDATSNRTNNLSTRQLVYLSTLPNNLSTRQLVYLSTRSNPNFEL
ncbi:DNA-directed RNA polymerase II [Prevotella sp. A2879]|uniref:DNA-directed RNA polymerase II n=1 Tax=Prevotella vespertina TaxID=2608404 RepID=A0A7C9HCY4_9BACT|nr:DNA-directed RNA polymerase II [Prevotella vespertina]